MVGGGYGVDVAVVGSGNNVYVVDSGDVLLDVFVALIVGGYHVVSAATDVDDAVAVVEDYIVIVERRC
jgi:hypothetical protein